MTTADKIMDLDSLVERLKALRGEGKSVALANGLFDILHVGHLRYLAGAAAEADLLVVAINSDESARRLKGPDRPITPESEKAELVAGFSCVDFVTIFADATVEPMLRALRPDVHCKGTDYTAETVPEAALSKELGIRTAIVGDPKTHATRSILDRLRRA